jgi:hypothetical protein
MYCMWAAKQVGTRALSFTSSNRSIKYQSRGELNIALLCFDSQRKIFSACHDDFKQFNLRF